MDQKPTKDEKPIDPEFEKAQKSMKGRVDPDPTPEPDPNPAPKPDETPADPNPPADDKKPEGDGKKPDDNPPADPNKKVNRPEAFIPLKKYHDEKREWEGKATTAEQRATEAEAKVAELIKLAGQNDGAKKDEDIETFMEETGFDRATVEGFLKLAEKRLLGPDRLAAIQTSENIVREAQIEEAFTKEFSAVAEPVLKKQFPDATPEQLEGAKAFLDQAAHTKAFHDKSLDFIIWKHSEEIGKLFSTEPDDKGEKKDQPPQTKKTIEPSRPGAGKATSLTVKDFEGQTDFSALNEMDPAERSALIKDFPVKTYENFKTWVKNAQPGVEVTRNGQKVMLK